MKTLSELHIASKKYKRQVWRYFYGKKKLSKYLEEYQIHELNALWLLSIETTKELCGFLDKTFIELENTINNPIYKFYRIEKKRGGTRDICEPNNILKSIQRRLNYYLQASYLCIKPMEAHGFVINPSYLETKCNIVENARVHSQKKFVLNIDLKDFFSNITGKQVLKVFTSQPFEFNDQIATALTLLSTYEGKLPTGAPTSPVISNFVCLKLDDDLRSYCAEQLLNYTRYADDLTFSSDKPFTEEIQHRIFSIIKVNGFIINIKKIRLRSSNRKQVVTGLVVNEKVNVDRNLLRMMRAMLHDLNKNGLHDATQKHFKLASYADKRHQIHFVNRLQGYINFVGQVRGMTDSTYLRLKQVFYQNVALNINTSKEKLERKIDFFYKAIKRSDSLKLAIYAYQNADFQNATKHLDEYIYTHKFISIEQTDIVDTLKMLLELK